MTHRAFSLILILVIETFLSSPTVTSFFDWLQHAGLTLVAILVISWLAYHLADFIVSHFVQKLVHKTRLNQMTSLDVKKRQDTVTGLLTTIVRVFIIIVSAMLIMKQLLPHLNYTPIFASAGIIGVALGFGAQSLVKDFLTGVFIITENQYRVGDIVEIDSAAGTVEHVGIRSTVIRDNDGNVHYLPNGTIAHVINKTMGFSKVNFTLSVEPDTDVDLLAAVINATGSGLLEDPKFKHKILEAPHFQNIGSFSQLGMEVTINGKTEPSEQWSVSSEMRRRLVAEFRKAKIHLAAPTGQVAFGTKKK